MTRPCKLEATHTRRAHTPTHLCEQRPLLGERPPNQHANDDTHQGRRQHQRVGLVHEHAHQASATTQTHDQDGQQVSHHSAVTATQKISTYFRPSARNTPASLVCSRILVTIDAMSEKKHKNSATTVTVANRKFMMSWVVPRSAVAFDSSVTSHSRSSDVASCTKPTACEHMGTDHVTCVKQPRDAPRGEL